MSVHEKLGLKEVINASGKMSILGVSTASPEVIAAQGAGASHFFEMSELTAKAGAYVAQALQAEAGHIAASAAAGIALSVAGVIAKDKPYTPTQSYDACEIVMAKGHNVDFGAPMELMVQLGGGRVVEAGYANTCQVEHMAEKIGPHTAAILYVVSHHCVQKAHLSVEEAINLAHAHGLPIIVDAAAEEDLTTYVRMGADAVIYSGGKGINGPSASAMVVGNQAIIAHIQQQQQGIGRAMKVSKELILGLITALEQFLAQAPDTLVAQQAKLQPFIDRLNTLPAYQAKLVQDTAGRAIYRAQLQVPPAQGEQVVTQLKAGNPAIYTRDYRRNEGIIEFDVRSVNSIQLDAIAVRLEAIASTQP